MIKKINYDSSARKDEYGYPIGVDLDSAAAAIQGIANIAAVCYETKNPLFEDLPQYHFDRRDMCEVFDANFMDWLSNHLESRSDEFLITRNGDEFYIIHFPSGTIVNWYKHMGRTNTCNKALTVEDLREFKKMLLADFGYEEVN